MLRFSISSVQAKVVTAAFLLATSAGAMAADGAITDYATDAFATLKTTATDMIEQAWPILAAIVVAGVAMRLFKKFASKAS